MPSPLAHIRPGRSPRRPDPPRNPHPPGRMRPRRRTAWPPPCRAKFDALSPLSWESPLRTAPLWKACDRQPLTSNRNTREPIEPRLRPGHGSRGGIDRRFVALRALAATWLEPWMARGAFRRLRFTGSSIAD